MTPEIVVVKDEDEVAREASKRTVGALGKAVDATGTAHLVLTGGSSAVSYHRHLSALPWQAAIDWRQVHFWWGDDRFVPRDHPESNAGLAYRTLFALGAVSGETGSGGSGSDVEAGLEPGLVIDPAKVHPMLAEEAIARELDNHWAAEQYVAEISANVPRDSAGLPAFDVLILGIGPDGHTMSIFPGSPLLKGDAPIVAGTPAPDHVEPHLPRVTLSARVLAAAELVIVMSSGMAKSGVMAKVLGTERDLARWPAQSAILPNAVWILDESAASAL